MVSEVIAGIGLFKSMFDIAKGLKNMNDATVRNAAVIELQEQILSAQEQQTALVERVSDLEKEMTRFETWETEKQRYKLEALPPGVHVYTLEEEMAAGEPTHHICQTCYQCGMKSILHQSAPNNGIYRLECKECGADLRVGHFQAPQIDRGGGGGGPNSWMGS